MAALVRHGRELPAHGGAAGIAMLDASWLWIVFTLIAAAAQTLRNATQRHLTSTIGTAGATQVRFLFGAPFGLIFLAVVLTSTGAPLPQPSGVYWLWILLGGL